MKLFELGSNELKQQATVGKQIAGQEPAKQPSNEPLYADWAQTKNARDLLQKLLPTAVVKAENATGVKPIPHVRIQKTSVAELKSAIESIDTVGGKSRLEPADAKQRRTSGKYIPHSFTVNYITYTVVLSVVGKSTDDNSIGINRKELSPTNLGLAGQAFTRKELIAATKKALDTHIKDNTLRDALNALLTNAINGGGKPIAPALQEYMSPIIGTISQDFGEILAPLMVMDNKDTATFPVGNSPLVDVLLPKGNLSVKAMTGSGTSFRTVADLMDKYAKSIETDKDKKKKFEILNKFHPSQGGLNVDKIVAATKFANIPEYKEAVRIFGDFNNFKDLENQLRRWPWKDGSKASYKQFLEVAMDVFTAGNWGGPIGMPADGGIHLGTAKNMEREEKVAGYPSFKANPFKTAASIITYSMGQGLVRFITKGKNKDEYNQMMTDIVSQSNAVMGHVTIKVDGTIVLVTRPFSDLQFKFQYHAPSHLPGNNLPGFIAVLD